MLLDLFKIARLIVQIRYAPALELWDGAGRVNRKIQKIWPGTEVVGDQVTPAQVILKSTDVQIDTGFEQSTVQVNNLKTIDQSTTQRLVETFEAWRDELELKSLNRVSSRILFTRDFSTPLEANSALFKLIGNSGRVSKKVFDQPIDSPLNSVDFTYRFEDEMSFAFLRVRSELGTLQINENPDIPEIKGGKRSINRLVIDFDRGMKTAFDPVNFRMDEWLKGFNHLLRRDIEKVLGGKE